MEETEESKEQVADKGVAAKSEQYNKPKDVRLPLPGSLQEIVGSLLFASETPLSVADLRECVRGVSPDEGDDSDVMDVYRTCTSREIEEALRGLEKALSVAKCGFALVCTGGQYRMQTVPECGRYVRALLKLDRPNRLSRASLETLAIVAYRQPITKSEVEQIRGVGVDTIMKSLSDLGLVRLVGRSELPGHPFLYGTTPFFLEHFGLASLDQLNEIDPTLPRSNPRERAKLFKKEEKPVQQPEIESEEGDKAPEAPNATPPSDVQPSADGESADADDAQVVDPAAGQQGETEGAFFIDDTEDDVDDENSEDELDEDDEDDIDEEDGDEDEFDDDDDDELDDDDDDDEDDELDDEEDGEDDEDDEDDDAEGKQDE